MKNKIFALLLAIITSTNMLFAESGTCGENLTWDLTDGVLTISGTGAMTNYTSLSYVPWYSYRQSINSLSLPTGLTSIGNYAFYYCSGLTSVEIPSSVTSIGSDAFRGCSGLTSVEIPSSVTSIGNSAFYGCRGLTAVYITDIASWCAISFGSSDSNPLCCTHNLYLNDNLITELVIPDNIESIGSYAFFICNGLTSVTIPNSVTSIGSDAFYNCTGLTSVTIGNSVTSIGSYAFYNCSGLTSVTIPNSVTSIGTSAFYNVPNIVYSGTASGSPWRAKCVNGYVEGWFVFSDNTKTTLVGCSTDATGEIIIPNSVTSIGSDAFRGCSGLTSVTIPNSVTSIGNSAFRGCSGLTSVTIPNSVTSIGSYAFYNCTGLTSVTIGSSVTSIGSDAFEGCTGLTSITIPNSVTSIGNSAFRGCSGLTSITCLGETPAYSVSSTFNNCTHLCSIYVPCGALNAYQTSWTSFASIIKYDKIAYKIEGKAQLENMGTIITPETICEDTIITAVPNYGYHFAQWSDGNTDNPRTVELTQDTTFVAVFAKNSYSITDLTDKTLGLISGPSQAEYLDNVELTAVPNYGYHFAQWSDGVTDNPRTVILTQDTSFAAEFAKNAYSVTTDANYSERGTTHGDTTALYLDAIEISASPNYGYHFIQWSDGDTDNPRTVILTQDTSFAAEFVNAYSVITDVNYSERGTTHGDTTALYLDAIEISASPNYGYHFTQWSDGNTDNPRTIELTRDTTFTAEFNVDRTGTCGDNNLLTWTYEVDNKQLTIDGDGSLNSNYTYGLEAPANMQKLIIISGVTSIGNHAFLECNKLKEINIPSSVTEIGIAAFKNGNRLETIHLGAGIEDIGDSAFANCPYILTVNAYMEYPPIIDASVFVDCGDLSYVDLYVPYDSYAYYRKTSVWKEFNLIRMPEETPTYNENIDATTAPQKVMINGQIYILRGDRVYTLQGQEVK